MSRTFAAVSLLSVCHGMTSLDDFAAMEFPAEPALSSQQKKDITKWVTNAASAWKRNSRGVNLVGAAVRPDGASRPDADAAIFAREEVEFRTPLVIEAEIEEIQLDLLRKGITPADVKALNARLAQRRKDRNQLTKAAAKPLVNEVYALLRAQLRQAAHEWENSASSPDPDEQARVFSFGAAGPAVKTDATLIEEVARIAKELREFVKNRYLPAAELLNVIQRAAPLNHGGLILALQAAPLNVNFAEPTNDDKRAARESFMTEARLQRRDVRDELIRKAAVAGLDIAKVNNAKLQKGAIVRGSVDNSTDDDDADDDDDDDDKKTAASKAKKDSGDTDSGNKKMVIAIIVSAVVFVLAGVGAFFYFRRT